MSTYARTTMIILYSTYATAISAMFNIPWKSNTFIDVEKKVINEYCDNDVLINLSQTNKINHKKALLLLEENAHIYLSNLFQEFHKADSLEEKIGILKKGLDTITELHVCKINASYKMLKNKRPNIFVLIAATQCANDCIMDELNTKSINPKERYAAKERYAIVLWKFLRSIMENSHISEKDKINIYNLMNEKVKNLKVSCCLPDYSRTIEWLVYNKLENKLSHLRFLYNKLIHCIIKKS